VRVKDIPAAFRTVYDTDDGERRDGLARITAWTRLNCGCFRLTCTAPGRKVMDVLIGSCSHADWPSIDASMKAATR